MIKGLSSSEERLGELTVFSLEKRRLSRIFSVCTNTWRESARKAEPGFFGGGQWQEVIGTNCNRRCSLWASRNTFLLWRRLSTFWRLSLRSLRYLKAVWTWSWAAVSGGTAWAGESQWPLPVEIFFFFNYLFKRLYFWSCFTKGKSSLHQISGPGIPQDKASLVIEEDMQY